MPQSDAGTRIEPPVSEPSEPNPIDIAIAVADPEPGESVCESGRIGADLGEGRAPRAAFRPRDALTPGVDPLAVPEDRRDREREVLHRARYECVRHLFPLRRFLGRHQPRIAPMINPNTSRPPARRVTRNDIAANHSGHTGL